MKQSRLRLGVRALHRERVERALDRALELQAFIEREAWWLDDYALFRALHDEHEGRYWREWDAPLRDRHRPRSTRRERELERDDPLLPVPAVAGRRSVAAGARGVRQVGVFGDFPFMVSGDSADVWARQQDFRLDASVGVPPDAFCRDGPGLGLPGVPLGRHRGRAATRGCAARAAKRGAVRRATASIISSGFYPTYIRDNDGEPVLLAGGRGRRRQAGRGAHGALPQRRRLASSPRTSASFRTSSASR